MRCQGWLAYATSVFLLVVRVQPGKQPHEEVVLGEAKELVGSRNNWLVAHITCCHRGKRGASKLGRIFKSFPAVVLIVLMNQSSVFYSYFI